MSLIQQIYCKENNTCFSIPLERRKVTKKTLGRILGLLILLLFYAGFFVIPVLFMNKGFSVEVNGVSSNYSSEQAVPYVLGISILVLLGALFIFLAVYLFQCYYYRYYFYDLRERDLVIKKGVISRKEITLPYSKIQNVFIDQDVLDRIFKLYDVHFETAGLGSGMAAHIDGVNYENSEKLRDMVMAKVKNQGATDRSV